MLVATLRSLGFTIRISRNLFQAGEKFDRHFRKAILTVVQRMDKMRVGGKETLGESF